MRTILCLLLWCSLLGCQSSDNANKTTDSNTNSDTTASLNPKVIPPPSKIELSCILVKEEIYYDGPKQLSHYYEHTYEEGQKVSSKRFRANSDLSRSMKYEYDDKGNMVKEITTSANGDLESISTIAYDNQGERILFKYMDDDDGVASNTEISKNTYNKQGLLLETVMDQTMAGGDNDGPVVWRYEYDDNGLKTKALNVTHDLEIVYLYNEKQQLIEEKRGSGTLTTCAKYNYDENGNKIESFAFDSKGGFFDRRRFSYSCK